MTCSHQHSGPTSALISLAMSHSLSGATSVFIHLSRPCSLWGIGAAWASEIVDGREAKPHSPPFVASLPFRKEHFCGGTLIQPRFVLTAAHGLQNMMPIGGQVMMPHGDPLRPQAMVNVLDRPANLNAQVAVAQLPVQDQLLPHGTQCLAVGWGRLGTREPLPHTPQELKVTVVTFLCRPQNVCTFVPRQKAGICFGDSGGPLICNGVLQAVDSFLIRECASCQYPDFFSCVALYVNWIQLVLRSVGGEDNPCTICPDALTGAEAREQALMGVKGLVPSLMVMSIQN